MTVAIHNLTDTWNDAGTTFTAIKMNVTDTASNAASLLMDLQVGGTSRLTVAKSGATTITGPGTSNTRALVVNGLGAGSSGIFVSYGIPRLEVGDYLSSLLQLRAVNGGGLTTSAAGNGGMSTSRAALRFAVDDAAMNASGAVVSIQNKSAGGGTLMWGLNGAARVFELGETGSIFAYNSFTDAANYERGFAKWSSNVFEVGTEAAGTGTARPLSFPGADIRMANLPTADPSVAGRLWSNSGVVTVSAG